MLPADFVLNQYLNIGQHHVTVTHLTGVPLKTGLLSWFRSASGPVLGGTLCISKDTLKIRNFLRPNYLDISLKPIYCYSHTYTQFSQIINFLQFLQPHLQYFSFSSWTLHDPPIIFLLIIS
jgi:hypothetical protein